MALRVALLLIGLIIVAVVVFHTFDLARLRRRGRNEAGTASVATTSSPAPRLEPIAGLDFDPSLDAVTEKRTLAADPTIDVPQVAVRDPLREELETLEEVATMPLNLDAGLRQSPHHADLARPALPDEKVDFILRLPA